MSVPRSKVTPRLIAALAALACTNVAPPVATEAEAQQFFKFGPRANAARQQQQRFERVRQRVQVHKAQRQEFKAQRQEQKRRDFGNSAERRVAHRVIEQRQNERRQETFRRQRTTPIGTAVATKPSEPSGQGAAADALAARRAKIESLKNKMVVANPTGPAAATGTGAANTPDKRIRFGGASSNANEGKEKKSAFISAGQPVGTGASTSGNATGATAGGAPAGKPDAAKVDPKNGGAPDTLIQFNDPVGKAVATQGNDKGAGKGTGGGAIADARTMPGPIKFLHRPQNTDPVGVGRGSDVRGGANAPIRFNSAGNAGSSGNTGSSGNSGSAGSTGSGGPVKSARAADEGDRGSGRPTAARRTSEPEGAGARNSEGAGRVATAPGTTAAIAAPAAAAAATAAAAGSGPYWTHNSSKMRVLQEGETLQVVYDAPRSGLGDLGIAPGTLLFNGRQTGPATVAGEAVTFSRQCGAAAFPVNGEVVSDGRRLVLRGHKPVRDGKCQVSGHNPETLAFDLTE